MTLRFDREDNGNCRVYYKDGALLYCWQNEGRAGWYFYRCSKDGEPSHQVTHGDLGDMPLPPGDETIGRELIGMLLAYKGVKPDPVTPDLDHAVELLLRASRGFDNETMIDANAFARHRRKLDKFLAQFPGDDPAASYDTEERIEHRAFVDGLFKSGRPVL